MHETELGRCENGGELVPENDLISIVHDGFETLWCRDCISELTEGMVSPYYVITKSEAGTFVPTPL